MTNIKNEIENAVERLNALLARAERRGIIAEIVQVPAKEKADIHFQATGWRLELVGFTARSDRPAGG